MKINNTQSTPNFKARYSVVSDLTNASKVKKNTGFWG